MRRQLIAAAAVAGLSVLALMPAAAAPSSSGTASGTPNPVTRQDENYQRTIWADKLQRAGVTVGPASTPSSPPSQQGCKQPITITSGGTYSGCWVSNGQGTAVTIATSSPVTITNSTIEGTGRLVASSVDHTKVTITRTGLYGLYPGGSGNWGDYAVYLKGYDSLEFEHNYVLGKGAVNLVDWAGSGSSPVVIRYNYIKNVDGRLTDGSGGYSGTQIICAIQLNNINNAAGIDIGWNHINNVANQSYVVDNISIYQSSGTSTSPLNVHDNFIHGAYPYPATDSSYAGGGIMLGDGGGNYTIAQNNQVVGTTNYGIAISGGQNETITNNTIISSGLTPDGRPLAATNVGTYVWNQYSTAFGNDSDYGNTVGWYRADPSGTYGVGRADWWLPDCNASCSNSAFNDRNTGTSRSAHSVTITAVGDLILGNTPALPAHPRDYLRGIRKPLTTNADIVFANLEGVLTDRTGPRKCSKPTSTDCFTFRNPSRFAQVFADVGFTVLNSANNHSYDYYSAGAADTTAALRGAGIKQAGVRGSVARIHVNGLWVAILGFAPYNYDPNLLDLSTAAKAIHHAASNNDIVIVYMHAGAEGGADDHVTGREEYAFGEDRGNPEAFAHMAVDNGAKLVIASGPHVLRGMQFYRGHLIAYSLGDSANYHNLDHSGDLAKSAVLRVTLGARGGFRSGQLTSVRLVDPGRPVLGGDSIPFVRQLGKEDFGPAAARLSPSGVVRAPA